MICVIGIASLDSLGQFVHLFDLGSKKVLDDCSAHPHTPQVINSKERRDLLMCESQNNLSVAAGSVCLFAIHSACTLHAKVCREQHLGDINIPQSNPQVIVCNTSVAAFLLACLPLPLILYANRAFVSHTFRSVPSATKLNQLRTATKKLQL